MKKRGKRENFTVLWGKNIIFEKGGAKISYFWEIYTPADIYCCKLAAKLSLVSKWYWSILILS